MTHAMPSDVIYELLTLGGDLAFLFAGVEVGSPKHPESWRLTYCLN